VTQYISIFPLQNCIFTNQIFISTLMKIVKIEMSCLADFMHVCIASVKRALDVDFNWQNIMQFSNPISLQEAYRLLSDDRWKILSGGTDFYPTLGERHVNFNVLDVSRISSLDAIEKDDRGNWHIGALVTWTDVIRYELPPAFNSLKLSAREIGSVQIQNRATLVGNICNASPAADGVPPLLTLGAIVKIGSTDGVRELPLHEFIKGNRKTDLQSNEMVIGIKIPAEYAMGTSTFLKLGARKYLVISISMVAARMTIDADNIIEDAAISVGSCSLVAARLHELERMLIGKSVSSDFASLLHDEYFALLAPIDDVRATKGYRMDASKELVARALQTVAGKHQ